jgi:SnoaL-like domain
MNDSALLGFVAVEDEQTIRRLLALYCHYFNHGEAEKWVELFAPEGTFERLNASTAASGQTANAAGATQGHAALLELANGRREMFRGLVRHQQTDAVITPGPDADHAESISFILLTDWRDGPGKLRAVGDCHARYVRLPHGWRFQSITLSTLPRS